MLTLILPAIIWMHALAVGYSPVYLSENADGIRKDWPRIPLPDKKEILEPSASLGEKVAALLDAEKPVGGVTVSPTRLEIQSIAVINRAGGGELKLPKELAVTSGWGHYGQNDVVMPGKGKAVKRDYTAEEKQSIITGAEQQGIPASRHFKFWAKLPLMFILMTLLTGKTCLKKCGNTQLVVTRSLKSGYHTGKLSCLAGHSARMKLERL